MNEIVSSQQNNHIQFVFNDGGRALAGFKGRTCDCVVRSIAIITGLPYLDVYKNLSSKGDSARNGVFTKTKQFKNYMKSLGFTWTPTMSIGSGCKVKLRKSDLPAGKIIAVVSKHYCAVIDGILHDTYDCSRDGNRCVYGYWKYSK